VRHARRVRSKIELSVLDGLDEFRPCLAADGQPRSGLVLGVSYQHDAGRLGADLDTAATVVAAVAGLPPGAVVYVDDYRSSATFKIRSRESSLGKATARRASNRRVTCATALDFSVT